VTPLLLLVLLIVTVVNKVKVGLGEGLWKYHAIAFVWIICIVVASVYLSNLSWPKGRLKREHTPRGGKLLT
jgi:L-lactate permease